MKDQIRKAAFQIGILLGLTVIAGAATKSFHPKAPSWMLKASEAAKPADPWEVTRADIEERWNSDVFWVDARTKKEFDKWHPEGALYIGNNVLNTITSEALDTVMAEQRPIVVYCDAKRCEKSKKTAAEMRELFLGKDIYYLKDGWKTLQ
ncbi:MAG: rhodanese-like domain-containing protein [Verrucomicrobiota bacterium]